MEIIRKKYGSPGKVIEAAVSDMEALKMPRNDEEVIKFVDSVEAIVRDLKTLKLIGEVANASNMGKIEQKFSDGIKRKWAEEVIKNEYRDLTSTDKFDKMMTFLDLMKETADYCLSDLRSTSGDKRATSNVVAGFVGKFNNDKADNKDDKKKDEIITEENKKN